MGNRMYNDIVASNEALVYGITEERYPALYKYMARGNAKVRAHLCWMWEEMTEHHSPICYGNNGKEYHTLPIGFMINKHGGSSASWQSHLIFLRDTGLLSAEVPTAKSAIPKMREAYRKAKRLKKQVPVFYYMKRITEEQLEKAERVAERYAEYDIGISEISKTEVILASGQERANELYADFRTVSKAEDQTREQIVSIILRQIEAGGYTTKEIIFREAESLQHKRIVKKLYRRFRTLCLLAGGEYHPQRTEDRERFTAPTTAWIVTKRAEA